MVCGKAIGKKLRAERRCGQPKCALSSYPAIASSGRAITGTRPPPNAPAKMSFPQQKLITSSHGSCSLLCCPHPHNSVPVDLDVDDVRTAADRAILDVLLLRPRRQVKRDHDLLATSIADVGGLLLRSSSLLLAFHARDSTTYFRGSSSSWVSRSSSLTSRWNLCRNRWSSGAMRIATMERKATPL